MEKFNYSLKRSSSVRLAQLGIAIMLFTLISSVSALVQAKPKAKSETELDRIMRIYTVRLNLTKEQQAKFRPVMEKHLLNRRAIMIKYKSNRAGMRKELINEKSNMAKQLSEIATKEQMAKYQKWQNEYKGTSHKKAKKAAKQQKQ